MSDLDTLFKNAPEGAVAIKRTRQGKMFFINRDGYYYHGSWKTNHEGDKWKTIATRPQPERKTVEDAVEWTHKYGNDNCYIKVSEPDREGYIVIVTEMEGYMIATPDELEDCVAAKAKSEPEWTHMTNSGYSCKIVVGEPDWGGYICVMREDIGYDVIRPNDIKPIKPTITEAEKEKCAAMAGYFNINPAEFDEYMSKHEVVEQLRKEQECLNS